MGLGKDTAGDFHSEHGARTLSPREIWEKITTGPGSDDLSDKHETASLLSASHGSRVRQIEDLVKAMDAAWEGDTGAKAKAGANPLKDSLQEAQENLRSVHLTLYDQAGAYQLASVRVQEVPEEPPEHGWFGAERYWPGETDADRAIAEYNEKAQANVDAFDAYFNASTSNASQMPFYTSTMYEKVGDDIEVGDNFGGGPGAGPGYGGVPPTVRVVVVCLGLGRRVQVVPLPVFPRALVPRVLVLGLPACPPVPAAVLAPAGAKVQVLPTTPRPKHLGPAYAPAVASAPAVAAQAGPAVVVVSAPAVVDPAPVGAPVQAVQVALEAVPGLARAAAQVRQYRDPAPVQDKLPADQQQPVPLAVEPLVPAAAA